MEQRGVIVAGIIAALVVAGYAWYILSQRPQTADVAQRTTPTPSPVQATVTPVPDTALPTAAAGSPTVVAEPEGPEPTSSPQVVAATAGTGPRENIIVALVAVTFCSGWYVVRQWRTSSRRA